MNFMSTKTTRVAQNIAITELKESCRVFKNIGGSNYYATTQIFEVINQTNDEQQKKQTAVFMIVIFRNVMVSHQLVKSKRKKYK